MVAAMLLVLAARQPSLDRVRRIVAIGDSITARGDQPYGWLTVIRRSLLKRGVFIVNAGVGGSTAPELLARFQRDVLDRKPDMVWINVGANDVRRAFRDPVAHRRIPTGSGRSGVSLTDYRETLRDMVQAANGNGIRCVLLASTPVYEDLDSPENRRLAAYITAERQVAVESGAQFVDLNLAFRQSLAAYQSGGGKGQLLLTVDGVHPNKAGNALIAGCVLRAFGIPVPNAVAPSATF